MGKKNKVEDSSSDEEFKDIPEEESSSSAEEVELPKKKNNKTPAKRKKSDKDDGKEKKKDNNKNTKNKSKPIIIPSDSEESESESEEEAKESSSSSESEAESEPEYESSSSESEHEVKKKKQKGEKKQDTSTAKSPKKKSIKLTKEEEEKDFSTVSKELCVKFVHDNQEQLNSYKMNQLKQIATQLSLAKIPRTKVDLLQAILDETLKYDALDSYHRGKVEYSLPPPIIRSIFRMCWDHVSWEIVPERRRFNYRWKLSLNSISKEFRKQILALSDTIDVHYQKTIYAFAPVGSQTSESFLKHIVSPYCPVGTLRKLFIEDRDLSQVLSVTKTQKSIKKIMGNLDSLHIYPSMKMEGAPRNRSCLKKLGVLTNLTKLNVRHTGYVSMDGIKNLKNLEKLDISNMGYSYAATNLSQHPKIKTLIMNMDQMYYFKSNPRLLTLGIRKLSRYSTDGTKELKAILESEDCTVRHLALSLEVANDEFIAVLGQQSIQTLQIYDMLEKSDSVGNQLDRFIPFVNITTLILYTSPAIDPYQTTHPSWYLYDSYLKKDYYNYKSQPRKLIFKKYQKKSNTNK